MLKSEARGIRNRFIYLVLAYLSLCIIDLNVSYAQENSTQAEWKNSSEYAYSLVRSMTKAHGGQKSWISKPAMKFTNEEYNFHASSSQPEGFEFVDVYHYQVAIRPATSIGYASFSEDASARIAFDGTDIWTIGLTDANSNLNKSEVVLLFFTYSLVNLPWLAQLDQVNLEYMGTGMLPLEREHYQIVRMTFDSEYEHQHAGYYELYIDPKTRLLRGVKQTAVLPKLPGTEFYLGAPSLPTPMLHVFKSYDTVDGLIIPSSYASYQKGKLLGITFIRKILMNGALDKALIDPSHQKVVVKDLGHN